MTKMTYVSALDVAINAVAENADVAEKLKALKAQIEKKNSAERKPTKAQAENAALKDKMVEYLASIEGGKPATEVSNEFGISINKATSLLTQLVESKRIEREVVKRKAYFKAVA